MNFRRCPALVVSSRVMGVRSFFLSGAMTPHTWLLSRHQTSTFIIILAAFLPTLLNWSLVCRTQILEAELAESSGRMDVVMRKGASAPQIFYFSVVHTGGMERGQEQCPICPDNNTQSLSHTQTQTCMSSFPLLCNFCAKLCQCGNSYLTMACFESRRRFKTRTTSQPLRPGNQESPSTSPSKLRGLNEPSRKRLV